MKALKVFAQQETAGETRPAPQTDNRLDLDSIHPLFLEQVITLYNILTEQEKKWVVQSTEETTFSRDSDNYARAFAFYTAERAILDLDGDETLKENVKKTKYLLYAYNTVTGETYHIVKSLAIQKDQNVYLMDNGYVMKWEDTSGKNIEVENYILLQNKGMQIPSVLENVNFINFNVLMIEFLLPLDVNDLPSRVAAQMLQQLSVIHTIGCYLDLKPDNIRKSKDGKEYYIIDMNLSTRMSRPGFFYREHWTQYYASQTFPHSKQFNGNSCYKNDIIELGYVLNQMVSQRYYESNTGIFTKEQEYSKKERFPLLPGDYFADPERMMMHEISKTARGWKTIRSLLEWPLPDSPTETFLSQAYQLPEGFPPPNVHDMMSNTIGGWKEKRWWDETNTNLNISCRVCQDSKATFRCAGCYHEVTFVCGEVCAKRHECK